MPDHTLSGTAHCSPCIRAGIDHCFMVAECVCTCCMFFCNPHRQCTVEPLIIAALNSGSSGVVVLHAYNNGGKRGGSTL